MGILQIAAIAWHFAGLATFVRLAFFDGYRYTWWNWIIAIPVDLILAEMWPLYWMIFRPVFGA